MEQSQAAAPPAPLTIASAADAQGNVPVWDHGPPQPGAPTRGAPTPGEAPAADAPPGSAQAAAREKENAAREKEHKDWHTKNGEGPVLVMMDAANAGHAVTVEPKRYALEPIGIDEGAIAAKVKEIVDKRAARAASVQLAADRKEAISAVMAERAAAAAAAKTPPDAPVEPPPEGGAPPDEEVAPEEHHARRRR